jgi:hypothetical protein
VRGTQNPWANEKILADLVRKKRNERGGFSRGLLMKHPAGDIGSDLVRQSDVRDQESDGGPAQQDLSR